MATPKRNMGEVDVSEDDEEDDLPLPPEAAELGEAFSIGDLAAELNITTRTIRFYESRGLLKPKRIGRARVYSRRDRARLNIILRGKNLGFSLEDIARYLDLYDADPSQVAQTKLLLEKTDEVIKDLELKRLDIDRSLRELKTIRARATQLLKSVSGPRK